MQKKGWLRRVCCGVMAAAMLTMTAVPAAYADYKAEWEKAEQELKAEKNKYEKIKNDKAKSEQQKKNLENQEKIIKGQIQDYVSRINEKNGEIAEQEQTIADKQTEIDLRWDDFQERMLAMQVMHDSGAVAMIANAKSLYDLLNFSNALQQISRKDTEVLEEMNQQKKELEEEKAKLEADRAELQKVEEGLKKKQGQLAANIRQQDKTISEQTAQAQAQAQVVEEKQKQAEAAEAQYEAWVKANASSGSGHSAEGFIWPLPGPGRITTEFGADQIINGVYKKGHKGLDIAMPAGTPIYAAHNGTVSSTSGHWSYGNVVMVDNGDGVTTLYAHMQSRAVSAGQQVNQGDVIGYVGSTGNSSGNHLHFEVRVNGQHQNPRNYVSP